MALNLMAATLLSAISFSNFSLVMGYYYEHGAAGVIHVSGKVMCQDCTKGYNEWVNGDRPINGSKVSLTCMDERKRVMHYCSDTTDHQGQFDITLSKYMNGKELNEKLCSIRLVSSPDQTCNILTDFAGGKSGVRLRRPAQIYRDMVKYELGTFYFTSPMCEEPDTSNDDSDNNNYNSYQNNY